MGEEKEENIKNFKVDDNEYRFNISNNITKDLILQEANKNGKDNIDPKNILAKLDEYLGDKTSESIHFKFHKIPENDRLKYYQLLIKYANFMIYENHNEHNYDYSGVWEDFIKPIIDNGRIFQLDDDIIPIIDDTNSKKTEMPFNQILIDCRIPMGDRIYYGMVVGKYFIDDKNDPGMIEESKSDGNMFIGCFSCYGKIDIKDGERKLSFEYFDINEQFSKMEKFNKYQKRLMNFFYSFCNLINEPDVEIVETILNPKNNKRRAERGSMPLPSSSVIKIYGALKKYVSEYNDGISTGLSHRFIVRGHFMHFRDEKRYSILYNLSEEELAKRGCQKSNGMIKKWVLPYQKGKGILINKTYKVLKRR